MFPIYKPEPPPIISYPMGNVGGGFYRDCLPFAAGTTITIAITSFDLIVHWLAYRKFLHLDPKHTSAVHGDRQVATLSRPDVHEHLTEVYFYVCVIATLVYCASVIFFSYLFPMQRKKFKEKRDGLAYKENRYEKYGSEVFVLLQTLTEDLPLSLLLLASQTAVSCASPYQFNSVIFLISICASLCSILWKILQMVWGSGCLGKREDYPRGGAIVAVIRIFALLLLLGSLLVVVLNFILFNPLQSGSGARFPHDSLFDKIAIDRWLSEDYITFSRSRELDSTGSDISATYQSSVHEDLLNITHLSRPIYANGRSITTRLGCDENEFSFLPLIPEDLTILPGGQNCSVIFAFLFDRNSSTIFYNYEYQYVTSAGECISGRLARFPSSGDEVSTVPPNEESMTSSFVSSIGESVLYIYSVSFSQNSLPHWMTCDYTLQYNPPLVSINLCNKTHEF